MASCTRAVFSIDMGLYKIAGAVTLSLETWVSSSFQRIQGPETRLIALIQESSQCAYDEWHRGLVSGSIRTGREMAVWDSAESAMS